MSLFASSWGLVQGSLVLAIPLIFFMIKDHTALEDDNMGEVVDDAGVRCSQINNSTY